MGELKVNSIISCLDGVGSIKVLSKIGEGGQGYVYRVEYNGEEKALKWYKAGTIKNEEWFKKNLLKNISEGAPTSSFLWPIAMTEDYNGSFGYVMNLRPEGYYDFSKFLLCRHIDFRSIDALINAAINIVDGFRILHNKGYSYQDLNDGNFFINPENGDVLICDNDNVAPEGERSGIAGKCRYMAPAVVVGRCTPCKRTDQFSLAVILFLLLIRNHPLEGELVSGKAVLTEQRQKLFYGENPIFIADPDNPTNRPVVGIHTNFMNRWPQLPDYIRTAFTKAFSKEVMQEDKLGVTEKEWLKLLLKFKAEVNICPECGNETRFIPENHKCVCCNKDINCYGYIQTSDYNIPLFSKKELPLAYVTGVYDNGECRTPCIRISLNKTKTKCALQNKGEYTWTSNRNGVSEKIAPGEQTIIEDGQIIKINGNILSIKL